MPGNISYHGLNRYLARSLYSYVLNLQNPEAYECYADAAGSLFFDDGEQWPGLDESLIMKYDASIYV